MTERELMRCAELTIIAWNRHDVDGILAAFSPDVRVHGVISVHSAHAIGREAVRLDAQALLGALPDLELDVRRTLACGAAISQEWTIRGTHDGELMGIAATGRRVQQDGILVADYDSARRVIAFSRYWDIGGLLLQLRRSDPPPAAPARRVTLL